MTYSKPVALATEASKREAEHLQSKLANIVTLRTVEVPLSEVNLSELQDVEILLPFIHSHVGQAEIDAMPGLKLIATRSTGFDHIDLAYATSKGILVANVPGYGETAVAEYTFALLMMLTRKPHLADARSREGDFTLEGLQGSDLYGKTIGVIGAGAIGLRVIRIATGFGMHVLAFDVVQNRLLSEVLGFTYVPLDDLLQRSDIVTLHAPAVPSNYHLINRASLSKMKRGSYLINTARGSLVDTPALDWAINEGILAGAALDTIEGEEFLEREEELLSEPGAEEKLRVLIRNHMLRRKPNVIITPHVAFYSQEALRRILDTTAENVQNFIAGEPHNIVQNKK